MYIADKAMQEYTKHYRPRVSLDDIQSEWIWKSIIFNRGNMKASAKELGISRATLYRRVDQLKQRGFKIPEAPHVGR